jgi:hypothetical protein
MSGRAYRAELAMDALRVANPTAEKPCRLGPHAERNVVSPAEWARQTANGQNWRWWQDYGAERYAQPSLREGPLRPAGQQVP